MKAIYNPKKAVLKGIEAWYAFTKFNGEDWPYMTNSDTPKAFVSETACQSFCDYQNFINR